MVPSRRQGSLTERDQAVLRDLADFRYLSTRQIARLHFGNLKLTQRRLRRLLASGYVVRVPTEPAARAGFHEWVYAASPGRVGQFPGVDATRFAGAVLDPSRGFGLRYAAHHRVLTDFRIWLREGVTRSAGAFTCDFIPGYAESSRVQGRRRLASIDVGTPYGLLVPDGLFVLRRSDGRAALFFLEIDRGSEPLRGKHASSVLRKLEMYRKVYDGRLFDSFSVAFDYDFSGFRVFFVTPDEARALAILNVAESADLEPLVWTTIENSLSAPGDLAAPVWKDSPEGQLRPLNE